MPAAPRVLVVEDHRLNRIAAARLLELRGCAVATAGDGREAVELIAADTFDVVFMDCEMPVLDGFGATEEIRRREGAAGAPRLPIIGLSAHDRDDARARCLAAGMDDYLVKPLREQTIDAVLSRYGSDGTTAPPLADGAAVSRLRQELPEAMVGDLLAEFRSDTAARLATLRRLAAAQDAPAIAQEAHTLKGSALNMGAAGLAAACAAIERSARAGDVPAEAINVLGPLAERSYRALAKAFAAPA